MIEPRPPGRAFGLPAHVDDRLRRRRAAGRVTSPAGSAQTYGYDPLGDLTSAAGSGAAAPTTAQSTATTRRDLTSATAPGGADSFSYNDGPRADGTSGPSGTASFGYNGDA